MVQKVIFVINPYCHQGNGWKRWLLIRNDVYRRISMPAQEVVIEKGVTLEQQLLPWLTSAVNACIISAGGDGTINLLVNFLLKLDKNLKEKITLGAIGLGSSNDFLKPFGHKIKQIPVRMNLNEKPLWHDVGLIKYAGNGSQGEKYFIVNSSFGVTAEANHSFNRPDKILCFLKKYNTQSAIWYSALRSIFLFRNISCTLHFNGQKQKGFISNINIIKSPFVSGSIRYPQIISRDDGRLIVNICQGMARWQLIKTLIRLQKGVFPQSPYTSSVIIQDFRLESANPLIFEYDGETDQAQRIEIEIKPNAVKVLKS